MQRRSLFVSGIGVCPSAQPLGFIHAGWRHGARWSVCRHLAHHLQRRAMAVEHLLQRLAQMTGWAEAVTNLRLPSEPCVTLSRYTAPRDGNP